MRTLRAAADVVLNPLAGTHRVRRLLLFQDRCNVPSELGTLQQMSRKSGETGIRTLGTLAGTPVFKTETLGKTMIRFKAESLADAQNKVSHTIAAMQADAELVGDDWKAVLQNVSGDIWELTIEADHQAVAAPTREQLLLTELLDRVKRLEAKLDGTLKALQKPFIA